MELPERKIYSVSELTASIKDLLERDYPSVWIQGEISNFHAAPSGHCYFTLKDEAAQIRCVMFKTQRQFLKFRPEDGLDVIVWGRISVYVPRGEYQVILDTMEPRGLGSLMLAFEQLRRKLGDEGLFNEERKRPLPGVPRCVGLVTSRRGAAVRDMIRIATRRFPGVDVLLSATSVQGDQAPSEIVAALERLIRTGEPHVIIIGRGGGSIEDLWAFNDERVVRAIAACPVPIVSAVGHETDFTLSDFAADLRASTPSAAAEMVVPDRRQLQERSLALLVRLRNCLFVGLRDRWKLVEAYVERLYDPRRRIDDRRLRVDDLASRLEKAMRRRLRTLRTDAFSLSERLRPEYLIRRREAARAEHAALSSRLTRTIVQSLAASKGSTEHLAARLDNINPLAVLARGYSITFHGATGAVVKDSESVRVGDQMKIRLHRGELHCRVQTTSSPSDQGSLDEPSDRPR